MHLHWLVLGWWLACQFYRQSGGACISWGSASEKVALRVKVVETKWRLLTGPECSQMEISIQLSNMQYCVFLYQIVLKENLIQNPSIYPIFVNNSPEWTITVACLAIIWLDVYTAENYQLGRERCRFILAAMAAQRLTMLVSWL